MEGIKVAAHSFPNQASDFQIGEMHGFKYLILVLLKWSSHVLDIKIIFNKFYTFFLPKSLPFSLPNTVAHYIMTKQQ